MTKKIIFITLLVFLSSLNTLGETSSKNSKKNKNTENLVEIDQNSLISRTDQSAKPKGVPTGTLALPVELVEEEIVVKNKISNNDEPTEEIKKEDTKDKAIYTKNLKEAELKDEASEISTLLNAKDVEITALIKTFSKLAKRNYIVDSNVKGKVTIHLPAAVTLAEAIKIFESVLLLKGFATVPLGNGTFKIVTTKEAQQSTIPLRTDSSKEGLDAATENLVTQLIRIKNVQAQDLQQVLQPFVSKDGLINTFTTTNSLVVIDSSSNVDRIVKIIEELDIPALDRDLTIIPITNAEAKDVAEKLNDILGESDSGASQGTGVNSRNVAQIQAGENPTQQATNPKSAKSITAGQSKRASSVKIIADERTNSIVVVADGDTTKKIKALVEQLDSPLDQSGKKFYVYRLRHADAIELADVINALISGGGVPNSSRRNQSSGSTFSSSRSGGFGSGSNSSFGGSGFGGNSSFGNRNNSRASLGDSDTSSSSRRNTSTGGASGSGQPPKLSFEGEVSVSADDATNSLIVIASRNDYSKLKSLVEALDIKRKQVLVEATILEVTINDFERKNIELQGTAGFTDSAGIFQTNYGNLSQLFTNPAALTDLTVAAASTGTLTLPGGIVIPSQAVLLKAVAQNENVNVLSSPTVLANDNEQAQIVVGQNVPFITGTSTDSTNLANTFNQVDRQDVGIKLIITPQISGSGEYVNLKLLIETSNIVNGTEAAQNGPTTSIRTTETAVEVKDQQMIVTGGLIGDSTSTSERGIPVLKDIPVLGNLFKVTVDETRKTNLLILLTPKIIKDQFDARDATIKNRDRVEKLMKESDKLLIDRSEYLHSKNIDKVIEQSEEQYTQPTTIIPPRDTTKGIDILNRDESKLIDEEPLTKKERVQNNVTEVFSNKEASEIPQATTPQEDIKSENKIKIKIKPKLSAGDLPNNAN